MSIFKTLVLSIALGAPIFTSSCDGKTALATPATSSFEKMHCISEVPETIVSEMKIGNFHELPLDTLHLINHGKASENALNILENYSFAPINSQMAGELTGQTFNSSDKLFLVNICLPDVQSESALNERLRYALIVIEYYPKYETLFLSTASFTESTSVHPVPMVIRTELEIKTVLKGAVGSKRSVN